jgi:hypothetical protein
MHLGPIDGPFVLRNLISVHGEPCLFTKLPDDPQTLKLDVLWVQEMKPVLLSFSFKISRQANPLQDSQRGPYGERYRITEQFYISLVLYPFISKAVRNYFPYMFPKAGPL